MLNLLLALVFVAIAACEGQGSQARPAPVGLESHQWTVEGVSRTGFVAYPTKKSSGGAPLVLVFHGHGGTAWNMTKEMNLHDWWPEAVVIYLQGLPTSGVIADRAGKGAGWQTSSGALGDRDLKLVDSVLAWAGGDFPVDPKRVFATGHSNGGWFTYLLWAVRPDRFAAFAPASAVFGPMIADAKPKPALIIAGQNDRLVAFRLQRRTIDAVIALNQAEPRGVPWYGGANRHESKVADVVTYVYPGAHPLPANAADVVAKFFRLF